MKIYIFHASLLVKSCFREEPPYAHRRTGLFCSSSSSAPAHPFPREQCTIKEMNGVKSVIVISMLLLFVSITERGEKCKQIKNIFPTHRSIKEHSTMTTRANHYRTPHPKRPSSRERRSVASSSFPPHAPSSWHRPGAFYHEISSLSA